MPRIDTTLTQMVGAVPGRFNILSQGNDFTPLGINTWSVVGSSVSGKIFKGPDGKLSSQHLTEDSSTGEHRVNSEGTVLGLGNVLGNSTPQEKIPPMRMAAIIKADQRTRCVLKITGFNTVGSASTGFDLAGGNAGYSTQNVTDWSITASTITPLSNGWWLCTADALCTSTNPVGILMQILLDDGSGTAANSISYAGDGTSGIQMFFASIMPKGAWGLALTFEDNFNDISTIDMDDTRLPGFNWYRHGAFSGSNITGVTVCPALPANAISVSNSILTIQTDVSGFGQGLMTVCEKIGDPSQVTGTTFPCPHLIEGQMSWDPTFVSGGTYTGVSNAFWTYGTQAVTGDPGVYGENDLMEGALGIPQWQSNFHDVTALPVVVDNFHLAPFGGFQPSSNTDFHNIASLVLPSSAANVNIGSRWSFFDGKYFNGSSIGWNPTGFFSIFDTQVCHIVLGAGKRQLIASPQTIFDWPLLVDYIKVYQ